MNSFIFIIGCGHSGTTILNKIIGNHKDIYGIPNETYLFMKKNNDIINILTNFNNNKIKLNKKYVCEKTPNHVYHINKMYHYTKNPKIIVITRDGRDVISSLKKRFGNLEFSVNRWINDNNEWLNNPNKNDFYILKYEDFISNKNEALLKICNFLEIEYYDEIFNYEKNKIELPESFYNGLINNNKHYKLREYQINKDIYDGSKRWLNDLTEKELEILYSNKEFMNIMSILRYDI
jgi:hypothetical protein